VTNLVAAADGQDEHRPRGRDPERTRAEILAVAADEFAQQGYSGARVDEIAARTRTTKRMIYYYFGSKEGLFTAALQQAYAELRAADSRLDLAGLDPQAALRKIVRSTYDYHVQHPHFVRLVVVENIHRAEHLAHLESVAQLGTPAVESLAEVIRVGRRAGVFHRDVDPLEIHMIISSFSIYHVANRHTFQVLFGQDLLAAESVERHRELLEDLVVGYVTGTDTARLGAPATAE
jgi:AcrR family transcriptional regulator